MSYVGNKKPVNWSISAELRDELDAFLDEAKKVGISLNSSHLCAAGALAFLEAKPVDQVVLLTRSISYDLETLLGPSRHNVDAFLEQLGKDLKKRRRARQTKESSKPNQKSKKTP